MRKSGCPLITYYFSSLITKIKYGQEKPVVTNGVRLKILDEILQNPGIHIRELQRRLDVSFGTVTWHIRILVECKMIESVKREYYISYYPVKEFWRHPSREFIPNPTRQRIFEYVKDVQGITQKEISEKIGMHQSTALHHLKKLADENFVLKVKDGKQVRYFAIRG